MQFQTSKFQSNWQQLVKLPTNLSKPKPLFFINLFPALTFNQTRRLQSPQLPNAQIQTKARESESEKSKPERVRGMKYVLVTGGVVSGLGKGVTASSIGVVLKACGLRVTSIKIDPYLNMDAGTMSPFEHGEVFVLDDGGEADLDLGNYERFLDVTLTRDNNITTGKIYQSVLEKERRGDYLGKTVQVVPHITDAIRNWIESVSLIPVDGKEGPADICVIELGGTVGDIESMPFVEALRQLSFSVGQDNFCLIHVSLIPVLGVVGEQKTKPTQHSVRELRALGLTPHLLACRSAQMLIGVTKNSKTPSYETEEPVDEGAPEDREQSTTGKPLLENTKEKLSQFCHVPVDNIVNIHDVPNIWHVPLLLQNQNAHNAILKQLNCVSIAAPPNLQEWTNRAETYDNLTDSVRIALVGKYIGLTDSYLSVVKAVLHACIACALKPSIDWIAASDLEDDCAKSAPQAHAAAWETLRNAACVLVPGGFGDRGVEGMILAAKYARENHIPYLGICLGMQISVIEFARSVLNLERANSEEFESNTPNPVIVFMPEGSRTHMGSTMRLGSRRTFLQAPACIISKLYHGATYVDERHRHRYEVNPEAIDRLQEAGLNFLGTDESGKRMEILELRRHPFYVGVQFHPEFKSRPGRPSALFLGLILAAVGQLETYLKKHHNGS
ncbi:hypothetical protein GIB67_008718 [Kingdonia uniflora]|uniref:CTP synthase n=1 Tax=Kingdonia uniflora TaxID=39325 RepID=A0A7J7NH17_9MAGN|nr:hypothetical protein GIB67_008718 [Kingdonia uniflora]